VGEDRLYATRVSAGDDPRVPTRARTNARQGLLLVLTLLTVPAVSAEQIAVRVRDDGRVDLRVTAAPLVSVLERLAGQGEMKLAYQGTPPQRLVTLEVYAGSQAEAVLDVLAGLGVDYAVSTNLAGTRVLSLVVADTTEQPTSPAGPDSTDPGDESQPPPSPESTEPGSSEVERGGSPSSASPEAGFPLLAGDFVPGGRANGQTTEWGMPPFVLPDPPDAAPVEARPPEPVEARPPESPSE
jgi:hypothetical protein